MAATKDRSWQTWAGSRSDVARAVREAADAVARWSNYPALVKTTVRYADDVSETLPDVDAMSSLHRADLPSIRQLWVEVTGDRDAYEAEQERLHKAWFEALKKRAEAGEHIPESQMGKPEDAASFVSASVLIRLQYGAKGLRIEVSGPHRDQVSGLFDRLADILTRRQAFRRLDPDVGGALAVILVVPGIILGAWLSRAVGIAGAHDHWDAIGIVLVPLGFFAAGFGFHELYPTLELVDDDQKTRAERFGKLFWATIFALATGIVSAAVWDIAA